MHRTIMLVACLLCGCADACDDGTTGGDHPHSEAAHPGHAPSEPRPQVAAVGAEMIAPEKLGPLCPDELGKFTAVQEASALATALPNGQALPRAQRKYAHGDITLELEIMDALHAPIVRELVQHVQTTDRKTPTSVLKGGDFEGHPAVNQWTQTNETARMGVMLGKRLIVNISVTPATSIEDAAAPARAFDYEAVAALLPPPGPDAGKKASDAGKPADAGAPSRADESPGEAPAKTQATEAAKAKAE